MFLFDINFNYIKIQLYYVKSVANPGGWTPDPDPPLAHAIVFIFILYF